MEKLEKLKQLMELISNDTVTPKVLTEVIAALIKVVKDAKDNSENVSQETRDTIKKALNYLDEEHIKLLEKVTNSNETRLSKIEKKILDTLSRAETALIEVRAIKVEDGKDADETKIIEEVLSKIKFPDIETPEQIRDKLEILKGDERLDIKFIKGLEDLFKKGKGKTTQMIAGGARFISQLFDVKLTNVANNDVLKWDATNNVWINGIGGGSGSGIIETVVAGTGISVDSTDPANPIITNTDLGSSVDLSGLVPYTGANNDLDLGGNNLLLDVGAIITLGNIELSSPDVGKFAYSDSSNTPAVFDITTLTSEQTYTLPDATGTIALTSDITPEYTLPTASDTILGGVKVGTRLSIDGNGVLSADVQSGGGDFLSDGTVPMTGDLNLNGNDLNNANSVQFDTTPTALTPAEGLLQWNATDGTLNLGMDGGNITQQIGQELFIKVWNDTGSTITNGSAVYFNGRQGNRPKIVLARGDSPTTCMVMGLTTQDIATGTEGFITTFGYVRQIKTDYATWAEGQPLWLSTTTAGALTNVEPDAPNHSDIVGYVGVVGGLGIGSIFVSINRHKEMQSLSDINGTVLADSGQFPVWNDTAGYFDFTENINNYKQAQFYAGTMTVNTGTLNTGTVADLQAVGGTDVNIQESNGADPLRVTFDFTGVTRMTAFTFFGYYAGGSGHQLDVEIYNQDTTNWDNIGIIGSETTKKWYSFPIFGTSSYINAGAVSVRLRHIQTGNVIHALILDYLDVDFGSAGGTTNVSASSVTFIPSGNLSSTNVASALAELDSEKVIANGAITGATKTKITYDAKGLVTAGADATTADIADSLNKRYVTDAQITAFHGVNDTNTTSNTYADGKVAQTITNGVTTSAPSQDAVFDALANKQPLATVLTNTTAAFTTAQETKLSGIAAGAEVNVNADWNAVSGDAQILNKPTLTSGTVTSVAALTLGTTGTDLSSSVATGTTTPVITLNVPTASASNRGVLSSTDWSTFNNKQPAGSYLTSANIVSTITNGDTTHASSSDALFDALALKAPLISPSFTTPSLGVATATSINGATITSGTLNGSVSGTNTGDQTSIVGISGTMAQFDTAVSDGNIVYQSQALGTPSSGTLTNCTSLPAASVNAGTFGGAVITVDHGTATNPEVVSVVYGTTTPPTANTTPIGTLFIKYVA